MIGFVIGLVVFYMLSKWLNFYLFLFLYLGYYFIFHLKIFNFLFYKIYDLISLFKAVKAHTYFKRIYGAYGVVGEYGQGKTIYMARDYLRLSKKRLFHNPDNYIIISNFCLGDTLPFTNLDDVCNYYRIALKEGKGLVCYWDEIQNEYPENDRFFPQEFRTLLTQNRKNKGVRLIWSTQDYTRVNKNIRLQSTVITHMRCFFSRYMIAKKYRRANYEDFYNTTDISKKIRKRPLSTIFFIQDNSIRKLFDSFKMLDSAKKILKI